MAVSRRTLLVAMGLGTAAAAAAAWTLLRAVAPDPLAALADPPSAGRIGRRLLAVDPAAEASAAARIAALAEGWPSDSAVEDVRRLVRERITEEFRAGEVTEVEGWYLARTEADLAILAAREWGHA